MSTSEVVILAIAAALALLSILLLGGRGASDCWFSPKISNGFFLACALTWRFSDGGWPAFFVALALFLGVVVGEISRSRRIDAAEAREAKRVSKRRAGS